MHFGSETHVTCHHPLCCKLCQLPRHGISFFLMVATTLMHCTPFSSRQVGPPDKAQACPAGPKARRQGARSSSRQGESGSTDATYARQDPNRPFVGVMLAVRTIVPPGPGGAQSRHWRSVARFCLRQSVQTRRLICVRARLGVLLARIPQYPTNANKGTKESCRRPSISKTCSIDRH
jgi:hypothetical protein